MEKNEWKSLGGSTSNTLYMYFNILQLAYSMILAIISQQVEACILLLPYQTMTWGIFMSCQIDVVQFHGIDVFQAWKKDLLLPIILLSLPWFL